MRDWRSGSYLSHFQKLYLELFNFYPAHYLSKVQLLWKQALEKTGLEEISQIQAMIDWYGARRKEIQQAETLEALNIETHFPSVTSISISQPAPSFNETFISRLKNHYLTLNTLTIFTPQGNGELEREIPLSSLYTHLAMIGDDERKERNKNVDSITDGRLPTYETIFKAKKEIKPEEMFSQEKLKKSAQKRVVVYGSAGIGKSTFVSYATHAWAQGKLWPEFEIVLCIRLRNLSKSFFPRGRSYTPYDFLKREHEALQLDFQDLPNNPELLNNTLLILDGYDELPNEVGSDKGHLYPPFEALKKLFPHLLITSRPGSVGLNCSCEFEILGFNDTQMEKYMAAFFDHVQGGKSESAQKLRSYLEKTPLAKSLSHIPINLTMLCSLFHDNPNLFKGEISLTLTALYDQVVNHFFKLYLFKEGKGNDDVICKKPALHPSVANLIKVLEKCAYEAMKEKSLYIEQSKIEKIIFEKGIELTQIKPLGLFRIENGSGSFIHLTFQEYFAASYVARLYTEKKRVEVQKILKKHKFKPHFNLVWRMTAGILSLQGNSKRLQEFFDDLFAPPNDLAVRVELELIAGCFEECQQRERIRQYSIFIDACSKYVKEMIVFEVSVDFVFDLLGPNSTLIHHPKIAELIIEICKTEQSAEVFDIIHAIAERRQPIPEKIVSALIEFLFDPNSKIGRFGYDLQIIVERGNELSEEAVESLIQVLHDPKTLSSKKPSIAAVLVEITRQRGKHHKKTLKALIELLCDSTVDFNARNSVVEVLKEIVQAKLEFSNEALEELIKILLDNQVGFDVKESVANILGKIAKGGNELPRKALEALIQLFLTSVSETKFSAKNFAAVALTEIAKGGGKFAKEVVEVLIQSLYDSQVNDKVIFAVVRALGEIAKSRQEFSVEIIEKLIHILRSSQGDSACTQVVATTLGEIAKSNQRLSNEIPKVLIGLLLDCKEEDLDLKQALAGALGEFAKVGGELPKEMLQSLISALIRQSERVIGLDITFCLSNRFALSLEVGQLFLWDRWEKWPLFFVSNLSISSEENEFQKVLRAFVGEDDHLYETLLNCYNVLHSQPSLPQSF